MRAANIDNERRAILIRLSEAMTASVKQVKAELLAQADAWTLAGVEGRAKRRTSPSHTLAAAGSLRARSDGGDPL